MPSIAVAEQGRVHDLAHPVRSCHVSRQSGQCNAAAADWADWADWVDHRPRRVRGRHDGCSGAGVPARVRGAARGPDRRRGRRVGTGHRGPARRLARRRARVPRHTGAGERAPPSLPVGDARPGRRRRPLRMVDDALSRVGWDRRGLRARRRRRRADLAGAHRVHDVDGPPLRLRARQRRRARRRDRGGPPGGGAIPRYPRLHGPRPLPGRAPTGPRGRRDRRHPHRVGRGDRTLA